VFEIERGDDDLADFALSHRIAGTGLHDFHDQVFVDDQAVAGGGLEGDQAEIGGPGRTIRETPRPARQRAARPCEGQGVRFAQ
jgi:hypothetical protein